MSDLRLPLAQRITTRDGTLTKDSFMYNMYREESEGKVEAVKRPGLELYNTLNGAPPGPGQGLFDDFAIVNNTVYGVFTISGATIPGAASYVGVYDTSKSSLGTVLKSLLGLYVFAGGLVTKVTDPDYPLVTVRGLVLLDGTYYVMTSEGLIYGSALEDPTSWSALNFIGTDPALGNGVCLFKHLNYVLAFCDSGLQAFYNAGGAAPGSPLLPAGNATYLIGCASGDSIVALDDLCIFMSKPKQRGRSVSALQGLSLVTISTPWVDKILNRSNLSQVRAFGIKIEGHSFYVLSLVDLNLTLVCDLVAKDWALWTTTAAGVEGYFKYIFYQAGGLGTDTLDLLQHATTGQIYRMVPTLYRDAGADITCRIRTTFYDGQSSLYKFFTAINLIGTQVPSTVSVRNSNDDYQTYSAYRTVNMNNDHKELRTLGRARRKAFEILHTANTPLRLEGIDFELYLGSN